MPVAWHDEMEGPVNFQTPCFGSEPSTTGSPPGALPVTGACRPSSRHFRETVGEALGVRHIGFRKASVMPVHLPLLDEQDIIVAALDPVTDGVATIRSDPL
jgi:hypothetical protein